MNFKKIDHLGIAVPNLEAAVILYQDLLGCKVEHLEEVPDQQVKVAFFSVGESHLELLAPSSDESPIARFLARNRPGLHHLCVEVEDLEATLADYRAQGVRLIDEQPRQGAHGKRIAFVHPKSTGGLLLELSESSKS